MATHARDGLLTAGVLLFLSGTCPAHGGVYRGPGDVVPPGGSGGGGGGNSGGPAGPTTGGPAGPTAPAPSGPRSGGGSGPSTGGPGGATGGRGGTTGGRGGAIDDDLTGWRFWWEFNKDSFLGLKDAVRAGGVETGSDTWFLGHTRRSEGRDSLKPTDEQIQNEILPSLKKAIDSTEQRDINSSCMVAMAKIGSDHADFKLVDVFKPRLRKPDQEIREVAALAIGIAAIPNEEEVSLLVDLALDQQKARDVYGGSIDYRTRSFATYGLGLLAHKTSKTEIKAQAFAAMKKLLSDDKVSDRNMKVAAINAMGILNIGSSTDADKQLLEEALQSLEDYYMKALGSGEQLIQSHCPTAIAKLIGRDHPKAEHYKQLFAADLQEKGKVKRSSNDIARSCAMALGLLAKPYDDKDEKKCPDGKYSKLLLDTYHDHKDAQARNFSVLALGQIGGDLNRETLVLAFDRANNVVRPWCALALGVAAFRHHQQDPEARSDGPIATTLGDALKQAKDPSVIGAVAISLGLARAEHTADLMRDLLKGNLAKEDMAGDLCVGLALMDDLASKDDIHEIVETSARREQLLNNAAVALGRLGDKRVAGTLLRQLEQQQGANLAKLAAISSALGRIGDRDSIRHLTGMLFDTRLGELSRAFAAVALGGIADKESLPWSAKLSANLNYRAAVETMTDRATGILDIL